MCSEHVLSGPVTVFNRPFRLSAFLVGQMTLSTEYQLSGHSLVIGPYNCPVLYISLIVAFDKPYPTEAGFTITGQRQYSIEFVLSGMLICLESQADVWDSKGDCLKEPLILYIIVVCKKGRNSNNYSLLWVFESGLLYMAHNGPEHPVLASSVMAERFDAQ